MRTNLIRRLLATAAVLCLASGAYAHPGHDLLDYGTAHALTSPFHLSVLAASGLGLLLLGQWLRHSAAQRLARYSGASVLVATLLLWSARF